MAPEITVKTGFHSRDWARSSLASAITSKLFIEIDAGFHELAAQLRHG